MRDRIISILDRLMSDRRLQIILAIIFFVAFILIITVFREPLFNRDKVYTDPLSGEMVYDPADRTPETYGESSQVVYLGFTSLIDSGVTFDSVELLKKQLEPMKIGGEKVTEISVDIDTITPLLDNEYYIYTFDIRANRKYDYTMELKIKKIDDSLSFKLSNGDIGKVTFD